MPKLDFFTVTKVIPAKDRRALLLLSFARIAANLLDIVGLAGVALLASVFGGFTSGISSSEVSVPIIGTVNVTEREAVYISLAVAVIFLGKSGFSIWLNLLSALRVAKIESAVARDLAHNFFRHEVDPSNDSLSKFQNQVIQSSQAMGGLLNGRYMLIAESTLLIAIVSIFLAVNPIASISLFLFLGLIFTVLNRITSIKIKSNSHRQQQGFQDSLQKTKDLFGIKREAQISGVAPVWLQSFSDSRSLAANSSGVLYVLYGLPRYVIETSLILGIFAFLGGVVVFSDIPTQATTIGIFMAGGLRLVASLLPLQAAWNQVIGSSAVGQDAFTILSRNRLDRIVDSAAVALPTGPLGLEMRDVNFAYGAENEVIRGVSFRCEASQKTAIVGPSGAGKTTIFDLALGFLKPDSGTVSISGFDPESVMTSNPGLIGLVPQRPNLVSGTLGENVSLLPAHQTDLDWAEECLKAAGLTQFVDSEMGISLSIQPDAGQLSGGEIQRLGLARALYRKPKILFLDEATSALDAETESKVASMLDSLRQEMTIVLIAHRLSTVMNSDKIVYFKDGRVVAEGTFAELKESVPDFNQAVELMGLSD
jgi:ABC-type multidrug transport system fused ATPase/permease subunit